MTKTTRRRHSKEFKQEAVRLATQGEHSTAETARRLGIAASSLSKWIRQAAGETESKPDIKDNSPEAMAQELAELRKEVKRLRMEREVLKKATVFFANESN